jgi:hypothetical protein
MGAGPGAASADDATGVGAPAFADAQPVALVPQACTVSLRGLTDPTFSPTIEAQGDVVCNLPVNIVSQRIEYRDSFSGSVLRTVSGPSGRGFTWGMRDNVIVGANGYRIVSYCATLSNGATTTTACAQTPVAV